MGSASSLSPDLVTQATFTPLNSPKEYTRMLLKGSLEDVRGVLGNKCAGQHNLKTVYFREILGSGNFLAWFSAVCVFFCSALSTLGRQRQAFMWQWWGRPPTSSSWGCPGSTSSLPALVSLLGRDKRLLVWNMMKNGAGKTFWHLFLQPFIENRGGDSF